MDITKLPNDLFRLVLEYLSPEELIRSRRVSKQFNAALRETDLCRHLLLEHFPRSREARSVTVCPLQDWGHEFLRVATRYHHLKCGEPTSVEKLPLAKSLVLPAWSRNFPIAPYLQFEDKTSPFHYPDTLWTYNDGILILPSTEAQSYAIYDVTVGSKSSINLETDKKIVRRIRLKDGVLIVEWCEHEPYHQLNENEMVYKHFATAYDVKNTNGGQWSISFRNEWKIHFLGFPLNSQDRFFSAHTSTHYAIYTWQTNRSAWGEDEPIEALAVWDISSPSPYRPSEDPAGKFSPSDDSEGPRVIRRFSFANLDFYQIRQRSDPVLRCLELDENNVYVIVESHRWLVGQQATNNLPQLHHYTCSRIPGTKELQEFPYLTITEVVDFNAGVVFSARHCFMLEAISLEVTPKARMKEPEHAISLRDDLWPQLLGKGKLYGDERFVIGENASQEVTILHFDERRLQRTII
ncbi:F-box domain protein [Cadophora sp. MPI-SDFR-AT-0126]|nr:F-box domain protein [Leotiomycetes sp. MPI-SDFR-AT-0126]